MKNSVDITKEGQGLPRPYGGPWLKRWLIILSVFIPMLFTIRPFNSWEVIISMQFPQDPPLLAIITFKSWEAIISMPLPIFTPKLRATSIFNGWKVAISMTTGVKIVAIVFVAVFDCVDERFLYKSLGAWAWCPFSHKWDHFADSEPCKRCDFRNFDKCLVWKPIKVHFCKSVPEVL
jgi:hypothetical protein